MHSNAYYNTNTTRYIADTLNADMTTLRDRFLAYIPAGGTILDAGCGPGRDAIAFMEAGYEVYAMDASQAMVTHCRAILGDRVKLAAFQDYTTDIKFDGIWACASLLHLEPVTAGHDLQLRDVLKKFIGFLKPGGVFFMSFKYGTENYVKDGRYFNCQTVESITEIVTSLQGDHAVPLQAIAEIFITEDVRPGRSGQRWVNVIAGNCLESVCSILRGQSSVMKKCYLHKKTDTPVTCGTFGSPHPRG